jgi:hypothetical protein
MDKIIILIDTEKGIAQIPSIPAEYHFKSLAVGMQAITFFDIDKKKYRSFKTSYHTVKFVQL